MSDEARKTAEEVLVLTPTFNDSKLAVEVLNGSGIHAVAFETLNGLTERMKTDCGAVIISEEALASVEITGLQSALANQGAWSDLPIILLTGADVVSATELFTKSGNISLLERPFSRLTLIRSVEVALRARRKQYEIRKLLEMQISATQKRDEFFATLSHELRTPLNVMLGWVEILRRGDLTEAEKKESLQTLERNARMQKGLIDDLLDISRIVTGKMKLECVPTSLSQLVRGVTNSFLPRAQENKLTIEFLETNEVYPVMADEPRLAQVITNLITNSLKFTPAGGRITLKIVPDKNNFVMSVEDTGKGVDPAFLPVMFDRLAQEDMSTTRSHGGMGLGLAIASHIVREHGGTISAESAGRNRGLKVLVSLPAINSKEKTISTPKPLASAKTSLKGVRVLVVDDSPDILKLISLWLGGAEAQVKLTESAQEALQEFHSFKPDVLLSDIGMPGMDGYQLISAVRSSSNGFKNIPAVALTAYARDEERVRAIKAGFQLHISKPIERDQLVSAIASLTTVKAV
jgi:signal transduction histidine kinase/CheY-like chemotaxis protein